MCANICAIRRLLNSKQQQQQQISAKHTNKTNCKPPSSANQAQSFEVIIFFSLFRFSPFLPYNYYGGENYLQTIDLLACCLPCCAVFFRFFSIIEVRRRRYEIRRCCCCCLYVEPISYQEKSDIIAFLYFWQQMTKANEKRPISETEYN